jgi:gamma-glutamyltranspeptidase/glutathione hydrolase
VLVSSLPSFASRFERERATAFGASIAPVVVAGLLLAGTFVYAATGEHGVVAAEHELASEAGVEMLRQGGNAVDAAVAAQFATGVVNPSSCGIGGGGFALIYDAKNRDVHFIDFRETAPAAAKRDMYVRDGKVDSTLSLRGALAVAVPGEVRGLTEVLRRYGTLPLAKVLEPAIRYASEGFSVGSHLALEIRANVEEIRRHPALAAIYLTESGQPYGAGDKLVQRDLAATLAKIAASGESAFYEGEVADAIAWEIAAGGGILTVDDIHGYRTRTRKPLNVRYRGLTVVAAPPPSSGGGIVLELLNVLGGFDLRSQSPTSITTLEQIARAERAAFADRARYYGDPDFVKVPMAMLLSPKHTAELRRRASAPAKPATVPEKGGTANTSAMDSRGNAVAVTTTINTAFGSMVVVPGTGIVLNNEMDDFSSAPGVANVYGLIGNGANAIAPRKRPLSSVAPTIVLRGKSPLLALGGSGGPLIITATLATILNVVDFQMPLEDAVAAPRIHHQGVPNRLLYEPRLDASLVDGLRRAGFEMKEFPSLGAVGAVMATSEGLVGISDPRKGGVAAGW